MNVAILNLHYNNPAGIPTFTYELSKNLIRKGFPTTVFTQHMMNSFRKKFIKAKIPFKELGLPSSDSISHWIFRRYIWNKIQKKLSRELDNSTILNPHNFPCNFIVQNLSNKKVFYCHEPFRFIYDKLGLQSLETKRRVFAKLTKNKFIRMDKDAVKNMDLILCNSQFTKDKIKEIYSLDAEVVYPGVDTAFFQKTSSKKSKRDIIFTVNSLTPLKGIDILLKAHNEILKKRPNTILLIGGIGPYRSALIKMSYQLKINRRTFFLGMLSDDQLRYYYSIADIVAYPSIEESFGLVPLEAMACETSVVAFNEGGPMETIIHDKTGILVKERDHIAYSLELLNLLENPSKSQEMGKYGRQFVKNNFTWEHTAQFFIKMINSL